MSLQTFPINEGSQGHVALNHVEGDFTVRTWDEQAIKLETDGRLSQLYQEGNTLVLSHADGDVELWVPASASIKATDVNGDVSIEGIRRVDLVNIDGDTTIEDISESVELTRMNADLTVIGTPDLRIRSHTGSDVTLRNISWAEIEAIGSDCSVEDAETIVIGTVGGDLNATDVLKALRCGVVGGDCQVQGGASTEVTLGSVGGDLSISSASSIQAGNIGASCEVRDVQGNIEIGFVGADASIVGVGGNLRVGGIGADAELVGLQGNLEVGSVGADLELQAAFPSDSVTRLTVGADARVILPDNPDLSIQATVGGDVHGHSIVSSGGGNVINLVYGNGSAHLELTVGGDLDLRGTGNPRSSSSTTGSWKEFEREMASLGKEMGKMGQELGKEMSKLGQELGRELGGALGGHNHSDSWSDEIGRKVEERMRRAQQKAEEHTHRSADRSRRYAEEQARRAEEQARRAQEKGARFNVRINDREWRFGPERLEHIQEEARKAAAEGIAGALEAVERAFGNLNIPTPPAPPAPPVRPVPPVPPVRPVSPVPPMPPVPPVSPGQPNFPFGSQSSQFTGTGTAQSQRASASSTSQAPQASSSEPAAGTSETGTASANHPQSEPIDPEQEREAILRMIAEGRITPEEGDLLLESLGG